jgi:hypothetical protein
MLHIQHPYSEEAVICLLKHSNPSKKQTTKASSALWNKYLKLVTSAIQIGIMVARPDQIEKNHIPINWENLRKEMGRCRNFHYLDWFHRNFTMFRIIRKGYPGQLTMIELKFNIDIAASSQTPLEAFEECYKKYSDCEFDMVPIDMRSLGAYIEANINVKSNNAKHAETLKHNLIWAKTIYLVATHCDDQLPMAVSESEFGRKYYKGLNLQNCPKIVRHAALGKCHQYDIDTSVFAWRFSQAKQLDPSIKLPATIEYITLKDAYREQLAKNLDIKVSHDYKLEIVKGIMTAVGFGSDPGSDYWGASIKDLIKSEQARNQFVNDPWFSEFVKEQKIISNLIFDNFKEQTTGCDLSHLSTEKGNLKRNKVMSYLYQHWEREMIDSLTQVAKETGNLLFTIHDGFYTKTALKLIDLKEFLRSMNPTATISHSQHQGYGYDGLLDSHRTLMLQEELKSLEWSKSKNIQSSFTEQQVINKHKYFSNRTIAAHDNGVRDGFDNGFRLEVEYNFECDPFYEED